MPEEPSPPEPNQRTVWRGVEAVAAVLVLGAFLYSLRDVLTPPVLFLLLWAVLVPFRGQPGHSALVTISAVLTFGWLLSTTGSVLAPFVLAIVLAYVLDPLVDLVQRPRIPRTAAIVLLTLPALGLLAVLLLVVVPGAIAQMATVLDAPQPLQRITAWLDAGREWLLAVDLPLLNEERLVAQLQSIDSASVVGILQERQEALAEWVVSAVLGLGRGLGSVLTIVGYVFLTPVLTFYLLRDWDRLTRAVGDLVPHGRREGLFSFAADCDMLLSRYLRGQVTVALAVGAITGIGLALARFPHAASLGLTVAVFSVVPYLGLVLSLIPALIIALVSGSVGLSLLKVGVVYGVAQTLEGAVISPRIVGESVGLHPVWVVLALAVGGFFFGFVGLLIGVPGAVVVKLLIQRGLERYRRSRLYLGEGAEQGA